MASSSGEGKVSLRTPMSLHLAHTHTHTPPPGCPYLPSMSPQELYLSWVVEARRHILAILQDYPSLRPPIDHLCELLPRLQARYYSIASSSKVKGTSSAGEGSRCWMPAEDGSLGG